MTKEKNLDKFYTRPDIAKKFVDVVDQYFPLNDFDMVIEPSAGCGNILQYLPSDSIGMDIETEREDIIRRDTDDVVSPPTKSTEYSSQAIETPA